MITPPPRSTLFPYTTLFRSIDQTNPVRTSRSTVGTMTELNDHLKLLFARAAKLHCRGCGKPVVRDTSQDRKSTRLNSSHMSISYAVFCLKKKKKIPADGSQI